MREGNLLYKELSYRIVGILYEVHNELGRYRNEKQYCDSIAYKLEKNGIEFRREKVIPVSFIGEKPGRNRVDFLIDKKIILEIKVTPVLSKDNYWQVKRYLVSSGLALGLLVNFYSKYCIIKRVLNPNRL